jgi:branched-chain amino acid transport system ATP-binding protein
MAELELESFSVDRGGFSIVRDVTLRAPVGEVTVLLGANGAGKTTLLEGISGIVSSCHGVLKIGGASIAKASCRGRAKHGLGHVEQGRTVFGELTVVENVRVSAKDDADLKRALSFFPELEPRHNVLAGSLSGGEQQMLVIARALAANPTTLLIDEMSLGLAPVIVQRLMALVRRLADEGIGILLVEQYAALALKIGDAAYVLNRGEIVLHGRSSELLEDGSKLRRAYLGAGSESLTAAGGA